MNEPGPDFSRRSEYSVDGMWRLQPELIRQFIETEPDYSALCREIAYILSKWVEEEGVEVATITWRSKSLTSFLHKTQRKVYLNPLADLMDRAGVRVVCHYGSDCERVEGIISSYFDVLETVDKKEALGTDRFGYGAKHFLVRLNDRSVGARYDDLRGLVCEIQVRSVIQDAWAVLHHHLFYKDEDRTPTQLLRSANSLAAILETVDDGFESLRRQRDEYVRQIRESRADRERFLLYELTVESFTEYLQWRFPGRPLERSEGQLRRILADLDKQRFRLLSDLDRVVDRFSGEIEEIGRMVDPIDLESQEVRPSVYDVVWAAALSDANMLSGFGLPLHWRDALCRVQGKSA